MSKLFIIPIPVVGTIKELDYVFNTNISVRKFGTVVHCYDDGKTFEVEFRKEFDGDDYKALTCTIDELRVPTYHLCSDEVNVGDKCFSVPRQHEFIADGTTVRLRENGQALGVYKIIGRVSPGVTWGVTGMEVKEEDVNVYVTDLNDPDWKADYFMQSEEDWKESFENGFTIVVEVRCPTCKTFH